MMTISTADGFLDAVMAEVEKATGTQAEAIKAHGERLGWNNVVRESFAYGGSVQDAARAYITSHRA